MTTFPNIPSRLGFRASNLYSLQDHIFSALNFPFQISNGDGADGQIDMGGKNSHASVVKHHQRGMGLMGTDENLLLIPIHQSIEILPSKLGPSPEVPKVVRLVFHKIPPHH